MTQNNSSIQLPALLVQFLDEYHSKGATGISIDYTDIFSRAVLSGLSINRNTEIEFENTQIIREYVAKLIGFVGLSRDVKTVNGQFSVRLSDGEYNCSYVAQCKGDLTHFGAYKITITILEKSRSTNATSDSPSLLDKLMHLAERQDFKAAIAAIPQCLSQSINQLQVCQEKMQKAKGKQLKLEAEVESAVRKARNASCSSRDAWAESADIFHRKDAIEKIQQAGAAMGDALVKSTDIHLYIIESQTALLEAQAQQLYYQKLLMDLSKGLLLLGSYNQQTNKALYQELRKQLGNANSQQIGELGMRELQSVAAQLKEHQDMLTRIEALEEKVALLMQSYRR